MAVVVAQPVPATPQSKPKMKIWFSTAFSTATKVISASVMRVRPMPLKNPVVPQMPIANAPPSTRGNQNSLASCATCGSSLSQPMTVGPMNARTTNAGATSSMPRTPAQAAREVARLLPAPNACAASVCTARPGPPKKRMPTIMNQYVAPTAAVASVDSRPMNQVSVRLSNAWMLLLTNNGSASAMTARRSTRRMPCASCLTAGSRVEEGCVRSVMRAYEKSARAVPGRAN